ncbi:hypothetical protein F6X40_11045 [Paraburkholderia sp. UCT31]|nr:hypothetical protein [Paraburkholderia sp. UCT31]
MANENSFPCASSPAPHHFEHISFAVCPRDAVTEDGVAYVEAQVLPLLGGRPLVGRDNPVVFDAASVLGHGIRDTEFWPFTCSCGVPECVGQNEPIAMKVDDTVVMWFVSEEGIASRSADMVEGLTGPCELRFQRTQYESALEDLKQTLLQLEQDRRLPVAFFPGKLYAHNLVDTVSERIERAAERFAQRDREAQERLELFGDLLPLEVHVTFSNRARFSFSVENLAWLYAGRHDVERPQSELDEVLQETVAVFKRDRGAIIAAARSLPYSALADVTWLITRGVDNWEELAVLEAEELEPLWPEAVLEIVGPLPNGT